MARYSKNEKEMIISKLRSEAKDCLSSYGVRKTSVDELVERVNIPKGTYYLFYPSKEDLLFEVICEYKNELINRYIELLKSEDIISREGFTGITLNLFKEIINSFLFQIYKNNEFELIKRKIANDILEKNENQMNAAYDKLIEILSIKDKNEFDRLKNLFKILFFSSLKKNEIGEQPYFKALIVLLRGISMQFINPGEIANEIQRC